MSLIDYIKSKIDSNYIHKYAERDHLNSEKIMEQAREIYGVTPAIRSRLNNEGDLAYYL